MDNKEYLSEERYEKINKKVNKTGTVLLTIGIIMVVSAIVLMILAFTALNKLMLAGIGGFLLVFGFTLLGFGGLTKFVGHTRDISAYMTQQQMPIVKEGMEKMAPTVAKVGKEITEEMAPAYGEVAKEITKGIKEGLKDEK